MGTLSNLIIFKNKHICVSLCVHTDVDMYMHTYMYIRTGIYIGWRVLRSEVPNVLDWDNATEFTFGQILSEFSEK